MNVSPACSASDHRTCPGYYKTAFPCECPCHVAGSRDEQALLADLHRNARIPRPDQVGTVNKGYGDLDYMGHAAVTDVLLSSDPQWAWEPYADDENGLPKVMYDTAGRPRALWIRLTVHGHTRVGIGTCSANASEPYKELIGDAIRNAAMRFGIGISLWAKEEWQDQNSRPPNNAKSSPGGVQNAPRSGVGK